jgi:hypothetical protein
MGVRDQLHAPATLSLESELRTHLIGGWVGPTASLNVLDNRNIFCPAWIETLDCPAHGLVTMSTTPLQLVAIIKIMKYVLCCTWWLSISWLKSQWGISQPRMPLQFSAVPLHICWGSHSDIQPFSSSLPVPQPTTCSHIAWVTDHTIKYFTPRTNFTTRYTPPFAWWALFY